MKIYETEDCNDGHSEKMLEEDIPGGAVDENLSIQEAWVWSLVWDDYTCHGASNLMSHNCWVCSLESVLLNKRSHRSEQPLYHNQE